MKNIKEYAENALKQIRQDAELAYQNIRFFYGWGLFAFTSDERKKEEIYKNIFEPAGQKILYLERKRKTLFLQ